MLATSCQRSVGAPRADSASARRPKLLFSDDFERAKLGKDQGRAIVVPMFSLENGTLKGTQMRFDAPAKDGKLAVKGHQAVIGNDIPIKIETGLQCEMQKSESLAFGSW